MGLDPSAYGEGKIAEVATLGCTHCGSHVILNPLRTRDRGYCRKCDAYICDSCVIGMLDPNYVHRTALEIAEKIQSGKWSHSGSMSLPVLTRRLSNG